MTQTVLQVMCLPKTTRKKVLLKIFREGIAHGVLV